MPLLLREGVFVRSGFVSLTVSAGTLIGANYNGDYWSAHSYSTTMDAYFLATNIEVYPSYPSSHYFGFPLRCLSTVLDM